MSLVNRTELKKEILRRWAENRAHEMNRVSKDTLDFVEAEVRNTIERVMKKITTEHPSLGKTIKL
jgi:hypothetical protein